VKVAVKFQERDFPQPSMRILLIADIHANWPALQAVAGEPHDICLCLGDLVDYGLDPAPCVEWVRQHARVTVRGNHDHGVAQNVLVTGKTGFKFLTGVTRLLTRERLSAEDLRYLARLPVTRTLSIENTRFLLAHASPRDPLDEYAPADPEFWGRRLQNVDADVVCVGHTHHPYVLEVGGKLVINPGSVGQPRDGDPRASYAVIQDYNVELKRIDYPVEETVEVIQASGLPDQVKEILIEVFRRGQSAQNNGQKVL
jgi:putative phosphoesterase